MWVLVHLYMYMYIEERFLVNFDPINHIVRYESLAIEVG